MRVASSWVVGVWLAGATSGFAQDPPAPVAPAVISRDAARRATVRAVRVAEPMTIDGRLDERVYETVQPIADFIQTLPRNNQAPTERTEAWVLFDATFIYVSARCWDSAPPDQWVANEMRRDAAQIRNNDNFGVLLDTFHDRRNGYFFYANPIGGRIDLTESDEGNPNMDWNPVWYIRTGRFEGGWTIEMAIPFRSLRYVSGANQTWGIQLRRSIRHKNEWNYLTPLPPLLGGANGSFRISAAASLVGLDLPPASRNIELKPYAISQFKTDRVARPADPNKNTGNFGIDAKYGVTANLTADLTYRTDFAQVEVDEQQVNLTRFSLLFPEKREFFLEGRGIFNFAPLPTTGGTGASAENTPTLFYSRRIGLNAGRAIPIEIGGRLSGRTGRTSIGALNIQTGTEHQGDIPSLAVPTRPTNFSVLRVKQDILRRSSIGAMFTNRSKAATAEGANQAYGVDANFAFFQNVTMGGYYARTDTPNLEGDNDSYQARIEYSPDRYGARFEFLSVGDNFNPEVGFLRRDNFSRTFASARFSPRPRSIKAVRKFTWEGMFDYLVNGAGDVESHQDTGRFNVEFENSDQFNVEVNRNHEFLIRPATISRVPLAAGSYVFSDVRASYTMGTQRRASGTVTVLRGHFYNGDILAVSYTGARVEITKQLSHEPTISLNRVESPAGTFTTNLLRARTDYAFTPRAFFSTLLQYSSSDHTFGSNLRFRWEYRPGSEVFVVYTDERDTRLPGYTGLRNRAFVVKLNRLFQF